MQILNKILSVISLFALFSACQPSTDMKHVLSKSETRMAMMDSIAKNGDMSKEMMEAMVKSEMAMKGNPKMHKMMIEDHEVMMKIMKENPEMMKSMMNDIMEVSKTDTSMMTSMSKTIMANQPMMDIMGKMTGKNMDH